MCTAINYKSCFGRSLDWEVSYGEKIVLTPQNYPIEFKMTNTLKNHFAILGTAVNANNFPLYYDAINEKGLCAAGLNFPKNCKYNEPKENMLNLASFEFILYILSTCKTVSDAKKVLKNVNITNIPFSGNFPLSPLHFMISDLKESIVVESVADGLKIYDNEVGVMTNNPPFLYHIQNLNNYLHLTPHHTENTFSKKLNLSPYSSGMGAIGLPGDYSSESRFVKAVFLKENSPVFLKTKDIVNQFFHILDAVSVPKGAVYSKDKKMEYTIYTSCADIKNKEYYIKTYDNFEIKKFDFSQKEYDRLVEY